MAGIPNNFIVSGDKPISSYDWYDATSSVGYKRFYAAASTNSTTTNYFLITNILDSSPTGTSTATNTEVNFDMLFKRPSNIYGKVFINLTVGAAATRQVYCVVTLYHVDAAATETQLATATTVTRTAPGGGLDVWRETLSLDVAKTHFAIGESFRLSVVLYANAATTYLYFDPNGADLVGATNTASGDLIIDVPFRIDL